MNELSGRKYRFRRAERLSGQKNFQKVLKSGRILSHTAILIYVYQRKDGSPLCRLGLIIKRKLGKAVKRNRIKRRLREIFRLTKHLLQPGLDIIFIPRPGISPLGYCEIKDIITSLLKGRGYLRG